MLIAPVKLPTLAEESSFLEVTSALASPAMEFLNFGAARKTVAQKIDLDKMADSSAKEMLHIVQKLNSSLMKWEHNVSIQLNQVSSKLFGPNQNRVNSLSRDLKKLQENARRFKRMADDRGLPQDQRQENETLYQETLNHIEATKDEIYILRHNIYLTPEVNGALTECLQTSIEGIKILKTLFDSYKDTVEMMEKPTNLRYGVGDTDDDYMKEIQKYRYALSPNGEERQKLDEIADQVVRLTETKIYGKLMEPNPATDIRVDQTITKDMVAWYDQFKKTTKKIHERLVDLRKECKALVNGNDIKYSSAQLGQEISFLVAFSMAYSNLMTTYFRAPLAIVDSSYQ